jgi:hypothetical protein
MKNSRVLCAALLLILITISKTTQVISRLEEKQAQEETNNALALATDKNNALETEQLQAE